MNNFTRLRPKEYECKTCKMVVTTDERRVHLTSIVHKKAVGLTKDKECPICYDELTKDNHVLLECNHGYCTTCVVKISSCALCRRDIFGDSIVKDGEKLEKLIQNLLNMRIKLRDPQCSFHQRQLIYERGRVIQKAIDASLKSLAKRKLGVTSDKAKCITIDVMVRSFKSLESDLSQVLLGMFW